MKSKDLSLSGYSGMTVNERLFKAKLLDICDNAIQIKDKKKAVDILLTVELEEKQAIETVDAIFKNPSKYGFK